MFASLAPRVAFVPVALVVMCAPAHGWALVVPPTTHGESTAAPPSPTAVVDACKIKPVEGLAKSTVATYPLIDDPVAFCIDEQGRFYFAESDRQERGIEDNRSSSWWLLDDIASETVEDRLAMYRKWEAKREGGMAYYSKWSDRIAQLRDADGNGTFEHRSDFAGPFNEPLDGSGAGLLAFDGDIFYTNIPNLWRMRDADGDGVAEFTLKDSTGYGVRVALRGHDMHGLTIGYDGKVYWSIGDRGYHVKTPDGALLHDPRAGAVFRMNPDGSELELYYTGLRNPQELAFDAEGNLFTGDNNSDGGDKARIVYCMEGGETGWSMDYQTLEGANQRGPWNQEGVWHLRPDLAPHKVTAYSPLQPAWTLPPLDHVSNGPSGLVFYPGLGLSSRYDNHFFLCDFLGGDSYSQVLSFALEPVGAGFKVVDEHPFVENVLPTDVDFGYDGKMYITDWGGGWESGEKGELYAVWDATRVADPRVAQVTQLFAEGFAQRDSDELAALLAHADRRVRQRAQFALAARGNITTALLGDVAQHGTDHFARVHAIWALGQQASRNLRNSSNLEAGSLSDATSAIDFVLPLLHDRDALVRAQAARMLGEARATAAVTTLSDLCADDNVRVRAFAAMALGKIGAREAVPAIVSMVAENADRDPFLRHAGVQALAWINDSARLGELSADPLPATRMAAMLAMRKLRDVRLAKFLNDPERTIRLEAARAINDIPMPSLRAQLADSITRFTSAPSPTTTSNAAAVASRNHSFTREVWKLTRAGTVADLSDTALFAKTPDESKELPVAAAPRNAGNQYIARIRGVVEAPLTGEYTFAIASDDDSILLVGTSDDPSTLRAIAHVDGYSEPGDYQGQPGQRSQPIRLEQGKRYAITALHAEGGGGDHCSIAWTMPDGRVEQPIGVAAVDQSEFPHMRRAIEACLAEGTPATATLLCDFALTASNPMPMRIEALDALGAWTTASPRNRVNGMYRVIDGKARDVAMLNAVLARKLAPLAENPDALLRSTARDVAVKFGVSLDPDASLRAVSDSTLSSAERVSSLRSLAGDTGGRLTVGLDAALVSDAPLLRAEARTMLLRNNDARALALLSDASASGTIIERQRAIQDLASLGGSSGDAALTPLVQQLADGTLDAALCLDVVEASTSRNEGAMHTALERWKISLNDSAINRYEAIALEGGDAVNGRTIVLYHTSAVCMKCHAIQGSGGNAAPALDGVATRGDARYLLHSMIEPNEKVAEGYVNAGASAMPSMQTVLTDREVRDAVAYLKTLQ